MTIIPWLGMYSLELGFLVKEIVFEHDTELWIILFKISVLLNILDWAN